MISGIMSSGVAAQLVRAQAVARTAARASPPGAWQQNAAMALRVTGGVAVQRTDVRMPEKSVINLPTEILQLVETQIAHNSDLAVFETGAEFWDLLMVAVDPHRQDQTRRGSIG